VQTVRPGADVTAKEVALAADGQTQPVDVKPANSAASTTPTTR